jgi:hypothetical protein
MNLSGTQLKDTYGNLVTTGTSAGSPTEGGLQNGDGNLITQVGIGTNSFVANTPLTLQAPSGYTDTLWLKSVGTNIDSRINIGPTGTGNAQINNATGTNIEFQISGDEKLRIESDGDIAFYDDANNQGLFWDADVARLGLGTQTPTLRLDVRGTQGSPASSGTSQIGSLSIRGTGSHFISSGMLNASPWTGWFQSQNANDLSINYPLALNPNGGNVGIGTTGPSTLLDVRGEVSVAYDATYGLRFYNDDRNNWSFIGNNVSGSQGANLRFGDETGEVMRITGGNVGIGATSVTSNFRTEIAGGDFRVGDTQGEDAVEIGWSAGGSQGFVQAYDRGDSAFRNLMLNGSLLIESGGNVGIGTASPSRKLSVNGNAGFGNGTIETIISFSDRGIFGTQSNHDLEIRTNGSEAMRIDSSGNVGIGITNPQTILDLNDGAVSDIRIRGNQTTDLRLGGVAFYNTAGADVVAALNADRDGADDAGALTFDTQPAGGGMTERMRIDSDGNVGIGTSPANPLHIARTSANSIISIQRTTSNTTGAFGALQWLANDGHSVACIDVRGDGDDNGGEITFRTTSNASSNDPYSLTERMRILSGGGITFNGDTATANALDDYEEGTFTPIIFGSTTAGTATFSHTSGNYTKIGDLVHFNLNLVVTDWTGSPAGEVRVGDLPFVAESGQNSRGYVPVSTTVTGYSGYTFTANAYIQPSTDYIRFFDLPDASADTAFEIRLAGTYKTDS